MSNFSFATLTVRLKQITVILGAIGLFCTSYAAAGLPLPASQAYVDARTGAIINQIKSLKILAIDSSRDSLDAKRATLRAEKRAVEQAIPTADSTSKLTLNLRLSKIDDEMRDLDVRESKLRKKADELGGDF